jgi:nitrite reductase/ring-hydroxylating ferredoxin subunit
MNDDDLRWTDVGAASEWPADGGRVVQLGARKIGVIQHAGRFYALKDACAHRGLPMVAKGRVADGCLTCPHHDWHFDLATGCGPENSRVSTWPVRLRDGRVEVGL